MEPEFSLLKELRYNQIAYVSTQPNSFGFCQNMKIDDESQQKTWKLILNLNNYCSNIPEKPFLLPIIKREVKL